MADFDDDFDLPLPNRPAATTAARGSSSGATPPVGATAFRSPLDADASNAAWKTWTSVYPIYIDAKRAYGTGRRRIAREKSCWWPQSQLIAIAASQLRLNAHHEPDKTHPRDWENPGRVKILLKENGRFVNRNITTKKQLLEELGLMIQRIDASQTPTPEQIQVPSNPRVLTPQPQAGAGNKPKSLATPMKGKTNPSQSKLSSSKASSEPKPSRTRVPRPPEPIPDITKRYTQWTPLAESGALINTVKVALKQAKEAEKGADGAPGLPGGSGQAQIGGPGGQGPGGAGAGKGKRKVIRVRG